MKLVGREQSRNMPDIDEKQRIEDEEVEWTEQERRGVKERGSLSKGLLRS